MRLHLLLSLVFVPVSTLSAAIYVPDLSGSSPGDALEGVDSWSQSEPNIPADSPLAWVSPIGSTNGAAVGGYYNEPQTDPFVASRPVNKPLAGSTLSLNLAIQDSTTLYQFRNDFWIGLNSGATNLFSVVFSATSQIGDFNDPLDPLNPATSLSLWNASVTSDAAASSPAFGAVGENAVYSLNVGFTQNGLDMDYDLSLVGNVGSVFSKSGTLTGQASATVDNLNLGFSQGQGAGFGDNFLVIGGNEEVPDTGSTLAFLGLSLAGLLKLRSSGKRSE